MYIKIITPFCVGNIALQNRLGNLWPSTYIITLVVVSRKIITIRSSHYSTDCSTLIYTFRFFKQSRQLYASRGIRMTIWQEFILIQLLFIHLIAALFIPININNNRFGEIIFVKRIKHKILCNNSSFVLWKKKKTL